MIIDILLRDNNLITFDEVMSIEVKQNTSDENQFVMGSCISSSLDFSVWNGDKIYNVYSFKDGQAYLYEDDRRKNLVGIFDIDNVTKNNSILDFECTDHMTNFDTNFKGIIAPYTLYSLLQAICSQLNIVLDNDSITNGDLEYSISDGIAGTSCRQLLKFICQMSCSYAIITNEGHLKLDWYDTTPIAKLSYKDLLDFKRADEELTIGGIYYNDDATIGTGYKLVIDENNPFMSKISILEQKQIITDLNKKINGLTFLPCTCKCLENFPLGSTISIQDEDGTYYKVFVCYKRIKDFSSLEFVCPGSNTSSGGSSNSSNYSNEDKNKLYFGRDTNSNDFFIKDKIETNLTNIAIFGVNEKSSAMITFNVELVSNVEDTITINIYNNEYLIRSIKTKIEQGYNLVSFGEVAELDLEKSTNTFKAYIDTRNMANSSFEIIVYKDKAILSIVSNAEADGGERITSLDFKENVNIISVLSYNEMYNNSFYLKPIQESMSYELNPFPTIVESDRLGLSLRSNSIEYSIDTIYENIN